MLGRDDAAAAGEEDMEQNAGYGLNSVIARTHAIQPRPYHTTGRLKHGQLSKLLSFCRWMKPPAPRRRLVRGTPLPEHAPAPAVCRAGEFQFAPQQTHTNGCVQSRALFWCRSGHGSFQVNGETFSLEPHDLYLLPWNRHISYCADAREPMFTAHVHLVPWLRPGAPWVPNVPHERDEPLFDSPDRSDFTWPSLRGVVRLHLEAESAMGHLINYATRWFRESTREESEGRALGALILAELLRLAGASTQNDQRRPEELKRLALYVDRCFHEAPSVEQLASIISRSRSHVLKLFKRHLGISAKNYIIGRQMREARELLLSTTLSIAEVGTRAGISDPYHFSKLFRRVVGLSPRAFRELGGPLPANRTPSVHRRVPSATES